MLSWKPPQDVIGFIKGFSKLAKPMTALLEKNAKFVWSKQCQDSFEELKKRLTSAQCLSYLILPKASLSIVMPQARSRLRSYARG